MLKIVNLYNKASLPCCYKYIPRIVDFSSGVIATLKPYKGTAVISICDSKSVPIGIIDDIKSSSLDMDTISATSRITVWSCHGTYQTDQFDVRVAYNESDALYCSDKGLFTTTPSKSKIILGYVKEAPTARRTLLQLNFALDYMN